ncbi:MAG: hypothetical protein HRU21_01805 [Pseudomonadales bacterium]|nr:hypothetical protein [Pseudomonadales bacterium]
MRRFTTLFNSLVSYPVSYLVSYLVSFRVSSLENSQHSLQTKPAISTAAIAVLLLQLSSCSNIGSNPDAIKAQRIIVLPTQITHKELARFQQQTSIALVTALNKQGYEAAMLNPSLFQQANEIALEKTGSIYDPQLAEFTPMNQASYVKEILYLLIKRQRFDMLLQPALILRPASIDQANNRVEFDGLSTAVEFDASMQTPRYPNKARGLSLKLVGLSSQQQPTKAMLAGVSVPFTIIESNGLPGLKLKSELISTAELDDAVKRISRQFQQQVIP